MLVDIFIMVLCAHVCVCAHGEERWVEAEGSIEASHDKFTEM